MNDLDLRTAYTQLVFLSEFYSFIGFYGDVYGAQGAYRDVETEGDEWEIWSEFLGEGIPSSCIFWEFKKTVWQRILEKIFAEVIVFGHTSSQEIVDTCMRHVDCYCLLSNSGGRFLM